jgi:DNA invertase Pin-like site-specific DNA recombinase
MTYHKNTTPKRAAIYIRVSTDGQSVENQRLELEQAAKSAGWEIVATYDDNGVSGAKGREHREAFNRLCKDATRRKFDVVMAWSVDRLGRSLQDLIGFLEELHALGVELYLHQQGIDTTTPGGKMMFQMIGVFAEFERSMIQERVNAGLNRAKAQGKTLGRPKVSGKIQAAVLAARADGTGKRKIVRQLGIGVSTVNRILGPLHKSPL